MKIMYCLAGTFNSGGMERIVTGKANWLAANGYDVSIVTTEQDGRPDFFPLDPRIERIDLDILYSRNESRNPLRKYIVRKRKMTRHKELLTRAVERENPDIVISTFGNEVGIVPGIEHRCKKVIEIHFSRWYRLQLDRRGIWRLIDKYLTRKDKQLAARYDRFVCLTQEDKKNWGGQANLAVIPNFIGARAETPAALDNRSMIAVGRLSYQKGYERMIEAWKLVHERHADWTLHIYGGGELEEEMKNLIRERGLEEAVLIHRPTSDIQQKYLESSALVLSSRYEGLPMVLLEAMACGLPMLSYTCQCGPRDIIRPGYNGLLVDEGDVAGLAEAINRTIEEEDFRREMGRNSFAEANEYLQEEIMPLWTKLFHELTH